MGNSRLAVHSSSVLLFSTPSKSNIKVMDKAMSLPLVSSAYSEVSRVTSPYMESTYNKVSPVVETTLGMVSPVVDSVKTKVEEQVIPHIPASITETVQSVQTYAIDNVTAAVEKVDHFACGGIDQLTEKVPQLKEATPEFEEIKSSVSTPSRRMGLRRPRRSRRPLSSGL